MRLLVMRGVAPNLCQYGLCLLVVGVISVFSAGKSAGTPGAIGTQQSNPAKIFGSTTVLRKRQTIKSEISSQQTHAYAITLSPDQYLRVEVECWGIGVTVAVLSPNDENRARFEIYPDGPMPVSVVSEARGAYLIRVTARGEDVPAGRYEIRVEELRQATARDPVRILAENALGRAEQLRYEWKTESSYKAVENYQEARAYCRVAGDPRTEAYVMRGLGRVYESLDEYPKALASYRQALVLSQKLNAVRGRSDILNDIGELHCDVGNSRAGLKQATLALHLSRATSDLRGQARALYTCAEACYGFGNLQKALVFYEQAIALWRRLGDRPGQVKALVGLGYTYVELSDISKAFESYNEALSISRAGKDLHSAAITLRALGNLQTRLGEQQQALNSFLEALEILQSLDDRHLKATILGGLGYTYYNLGEKRRAIEYCGQALTMFGEINHRWGEAEAAMFIGGIYTSLGEFETAFDRYHRALFLFRALGMPRYQAQTLRDMGLAYASRGDNAKALECYAQSIALTRTGQDQRDAAYTLNYIGRVYEGSNQKEKAMGYYKRALPLSRVAADPAGESLTLYNIARLQRDLGDLKGARAGIEAAVAIAESQRTKVASRDLRATYFASAHQYYELYIDVLMRSHKQNPAHGNDIIAIDVSERARARALLDMLEDAHADVSQGVDGAMLERKGLLQRMLRDKTERQMRLLAGQYDKEEAAALAKQVDEIRKNYDELEREIRTARPNYAALEQLHPLSLREIQRQAIDDDSLLLEYSLGEERSYLWAITNTEVVSYELPGRAEVEGLANQVRDILTAPQFVTGESYEQRQARLDESETRYWQCASSLSRILLGPAAAQLENKRLIIVADDPLQYVPFCALPEPGSPSDDMIPLVIHHEITCQPSASALATLRKKIQSRPPASGMLAVFADPVFEKDDSRFKAEQETAVVDASEHQPREEVYRALREVGVVGDGRSIPRLFASRDEAAAILAVTSRTATLKAVGFDACKAIATGSELSKYRIVHFATHGVFDSDNPELSGLVLSLFDRHGDAQDGFLRLNDIYNMDLSADLVVLSACNTALGKQIKGEGLIGLTRGFMYAGAARVMASLWKVDDEATAELIKHFYREMLVNRTSPAEALRQAQISMWRQKRWRSPYFWAAFVLQGEYRGEIDAGNRSQKGEINLMTAALTLAALCCAMLYVARRIMLRKKRLA